MTCKLPAALAAATFLVLPAGASAAGFQPLKAKTAHGFKLQRHGFGATIYNRVNQLQHQPGYSPSSVGEVLADMNRDISSAQGSPTLARVKHLATAFGWEPGDNNVSYWYPQGLTGQGNTVIASWYSKNGKGVRFSFANFGSAHYRHVLAVQPLKGGHFALVKVHAGGIAWLGHYLYVVDTKNGLRVFDTDRLTHIKKKHQNETLGYAYVLPQVGSYKSVGSHLTYSYVSNEGNRLIVGEYRKSAGARILTWPVDPATKLIAPKSAAGGGWTAPVDRIQGAMTLRGQVLGSSSRKGGYLYVGKPGKPTRRYGWGKGPEDLWFRSNANEVLSLTESPGARTVFGVGAGSLGL